MTDLFSITAASAGSHSFFTLASAIVPCSVLSVWSDEGLQLWTAFSCKACAISTLLRQSGRCECGGLNEQSEKVPDHNAQAVIILLPFINVPSSAQKQNISLVTCTIIAYSYCVRWASPCTQFGYSSQKLELILFTKPQILNVSKRSNHMWRQAIYNWTQ